MKVLIIHTTYQFAGGEDTVVAEESKLLQSHGITTDLLEFSNAGKSLFKILQLPFNISSYRKVTKKIRSFEPDIVHIHNLHYAASPSVIYAIRNSGIPFVVTLHNFRLLCPTATFFYKGKPFLKSLTEKFPFTAVRKGVYRNSRLLTFWVAFSTYIHHVLRTWNLADRYILLTDHARSIFLKSNLHLFPEKIVVKSNFSSIPQAVNEGKKDDFAYIGRLTDEKGVRLLLKAFSIAGYTLKIAGDGPLVQEVIDHSLKFPNIIYLGKLEKQEVHRLLNSSSALVFPSIWYEGMPLTIIEAFAHGTPVIASRIGAMETMVSHLVNGLHFEAGSLEHLLHALKAWRCLPENQKQLLSDNAKSSYESHYSPEKNLKQLLSVYQSVLDERGGDVKLRNALKWSGDQL